MPKEKFKEWKNRASLAVPTFKLMRLGYRRDNLWKKSHPWNREKIESRHEDLGRKIEKLENEILGKIEENEKSRLDWTGKADIFAKTGGKPIRIVSKSLVITAVWTGILTIGDYAFGGGWKMPMKVDAQFMFILGKYLEHLVQGAVVGAGVTLIDGAYDLAWEVKHIARAAKKSIKPLHDGQTQQKQSV